MRVFNLSDCTPPYKPARAGRTLKIKGIVIKPGEYGEVSDTVPTSEFSGLIVSNMVSVGMIPDWYTQAKVPVPPKVEVVEDPPFLAEEMSVQMDELEAEEKVEEPPVEEAPRYEKKKRKRS
jgi:hypothetical protein